MPFKMHKIIFLEYNFMHFEREMPFKMHKILFLPEKKITKKFECLPYLKFSNLLSETHLFLWHFKTEENCVVGEKM